MIESESESSTEVGEGGKTSVRKEADSLQLKGETSFT